MSRVQSDLFTDYRSVDNPATKAWAGWVRELAELAAVFVTVGAAHLLAALLGHQQNGAVMLIGLGVTLVAVAAVLRTALHRRATSAQPGARTGPRRGGRARLRRRAERHTAALRGARRGHTLWRIRTTVPDEPGSLAQLCASLSRLGVNILSVELHPLGEVVADELIVDAPPGVGAGELLPAARSGPGASTWVSRADPHDLTDLPTRILGLAGRVAADPAELPMALRDLYAGSAVTWTPEQPDDESPTRMCLDDPAGGRLVLSRPQLPFSPAELARARALAALAVHDRAGRRCED